MTSQDEPIPISALRLFTYCPRQAALVLVDGEWLDNAATVRGRLGHKRADTPSDRLERGRRVVRAVPLWSSRWNLTGRADVLELYGDRIVPVEYKMGRPHGRSADVQLCAQALCLEEMTGHPVNEGAVWYSGLRRRLRVEFDEALRAFTISVILMVHELRVLSRLPEPPNDERCTKCQFLHTCLPGVCRNQEALRRYIEQSVMLCSS